MTWVTLGLIYIHLASKESLCEAWFFGLRVCVCICTLSGLHMHTLWYPGEFFCHQKRECILFVQGPLLQTELASVPGQNFWERAPKDQNASLDATQSILMKSIPVAGDLLA